MNAIKSKGKLPKENCREICQAWKSPQFRDFDVMEITSKASWIKFPTKCSPHFLGQFPRLNGKVGLTGKAWRA